MKEVTKKEFKAIFLKYGKREDGWGKGYWKKLQKTYGKYNLRYLVELPKNPKESVMFVVDDYYSNNEIRLFFMSVDQMKDSLPKLSDFPKGTEFIIKEWDVPLVSIPGKGYFIWYGGKPREYDVTGLKPGNNWKADSFEHWLKIVEESALP
jgi:hypothetical protein